MWASVLSLTIWTLLSKHDLVTPSVWFPPSSCCCFHSTTCLLLLSCLIQLNLHGFLFRWALIFFVGHWVQFSAGAKFHFTESILRVPSHYWKVRCKSLFFIVHRVCFSAGASFHILRVPFYWINFKSSILLSKKRVRVRVQELLFHHCWEFHFLEPILRVPHISKEKMSFATTMSFMWAHPLLSSVDPVSFSLLIISQSLKNGMLQALEEVFVRRIFQNSALSEESNTRPQAYQHAC